MNLVYINPTKMGHSQTYHGHVLIGSSVEGDARIRTCMTSYGPSQNILEYKFGLLNGKLTPYSTSKTSY